MCARAASPLRLSAYFKASVSPNQSSVNPAHRTFKTITAWLDDELDSHPKQIVDDYTSVCAAALSAAMKA